MATDEQTGASVDTAQRPAREHVTVTPAQVAAARLQVTLDGKFGRKTPEIIKKIAALDYRP